MVRMLEADFSLQTKYPIFFILLVHHSDSLHYLIQWFKMDRYHYRPCKNLDGNNSWCYKHILACKQNIPFILFYYFIIQSLFIILSNDFKCIGIVIALANNLADDNIWFYKQILACKLNIPFSIHILLVHHSFSYQMI